MCACMSRTLTAFSYPRFGRAAALATVTAGLALAAAGPAAAHHLAGRPHMPQNLRIVTTTSTTATITWTRTARRFYLFKNGNRVASTTRIRHTFRNLDCNRGYRFGVRALGKNGSSSVASRWVHTGCLRVRPGRSRQRRAPRPQRKRPRGRPARHDRRRMERLGPLQLHAPLAPLQRGGPGLQPHRRRLRHRLPRLRRRRRQKDPLPGRGREWLRRDHRHLVRRRPRGRPGRHPAPAAASGRSSASPTIRLRLRRPRRTASRRPGR